jgi:hypothetical protein
VCVSFIEIGGATERSGCPNEVRAKQSEVRDDDGRAE